MALAKGVTVFDAYGRAKTGSKVDEKDWDYKIIPQTASRLKEKYGIKMDKKVIIPTDKTLIDNLFKAGLEMLLECGVYCIDTGRVIKYTVEEVLAAIKAAPAKAILGEGKDAVELACRSYKDAKPPLIQGGPTGAPVSEEYFIKVHESMPRNPWWTLLWTSCCRPLTATTRCPTAPGKSPR